MKAVLFEVQIGRRRDVVHLVAQGLGLDVHGVVHAGHLVDDERVRSGHVDHYRCVDLGTVGQRDPGHPVIGPPNFDHLSIEAELTTLGLGGPLQVVGGQLGVADITRVRGVEGADQLSLRLGPEAIVFRTARFAVGAVLVERVALPELIVVQYLVGHAHLVEQRQDLFVVSALEHEQDGAALHVQGVAALVLAVQVVRPVLPIREAFVGHGHAVKC